jgi:acetylornithine deacetylase
MKSVVDFLLELIRIPSVSTLSNRPIIDYARAALEAAGWSAMEQVHRDEVGLEKINLIAAPPGQNPQASATDLALVCHTDTVPYAADWPEAIHPAVRNGMVHGCGACDVKGFLACLLAAASQSSADAILRQLRIVLTADEETGCRGAHRLLAAGSLRARQVVIGEPTSLSPARAGKGYCLARITVYGAEAHSAHPQQGRSAILDAARLIAKIERAGERIMEQKNPFFTPPYTTLNIGTIAGGTAKNIVPGRCMFLLEWRPIPGKPSGHVEERLQELISSIRIEDPGFHCEVEVLRQQSGFETSSHAPLIRSLESLSGRAAISIPFGSEASVLQPIGEEVVVWGPGDMRTAHSARECVPVAELEEAVCLIRMLLYAPSLHS